MLEKKDSIFLLLYTVVQACMNGVFDQMLRGWVLFEKPIYSSRLCLYIDHFCFSLCWPFLCLKLRSKEVMSPCLANSLLKGWLFHLSLVDDITWPNQAILNKLTPLLQFFSSFCKSSCVSIHLCSYPNQAIYFKIELNICGFTTFQPM